MGTDIHTVWQVKLGNVWRETPHNYSEDRHYRLFAWLANVRNGYGFAGCYMHQPLIPLSDNRGLPSDFIVANETHYSHFEALSSQRKKYFNEYPEDYGTRDRAGVWMGDHSYTYVTAREVLSAQDQAIKFTGIVSIAEYRSWDGKSQPDNYCGEISGPNIDLAESPDLISNLTTHVRVFWEENILESFKYFTDEVKRLSDIYGIDNVRIVMGFDS